MLVYISQYLFVTILLFYYQKVRDGFEKNAIFIIVICITGLISGFRHELGADYAGYLLSENSDFEFMFNSMIKLFDLLQLPRVYIFLIYSLVTSTFVFLFMRQYNNKLLFVMVCIYFALPHYYFQSYNLIRQMAAVSVFAYASSINDKSIKRNLLFLISFMFHPSVIFALPFVLIFDKYQQIKYDFIFYICSFVFVLYEGSIKYILQKVSNIQIAHYSMYVNQSISTNTQISVNFGTVFIINIAATLLIFHKKKQLYELGLGKAFNYFIVGQILSNVLFYEPTLIRASYYFVVYFIILVPYITVIYPLLNSPVVRFILVFFFFILLINFLVMPNNPVVPYKSYFDGI